MFDCSTCAHAGTSAFCALSPRSRSLLDHHSTVADHSAGSTLFQEGDCCAAIHIICSGLVKVSAGSRDGRTLILQIAGPGDVLGLSAGLSGQALEATAEVIERSRTKAVPSNYVKALLNESAELSMAAAQALASNYLHAIEQARVVALPISSAGRLARLILNWSVDTQQKDEKGWMVVPLTHHELAAMTGISRETVSRTLMQFRKRKIIDTHGVVLRVLQPMALQRLSGR
jgi:CRP/FNR family transcriptional regulator